MSTRSEAGRERFFLKSRIYLSEAITPGPTQGLTVTGQKEFSDFASPLILNHIVSTIPSVFLVVKIW